MGDTLANLLVRVGGETSGFFQSMGGVLKKTGQVATEFVKFGAVAAGAIVAVGAAAGKFAMDFQDQMADVNTLLSGDTTDKLRELGSEVKRISILTGKGVDNVAGGLYEVISAFGDTADAAKQLEIATKAAIGGKAETVDAVKMLSTVTKGYGDTSAATVQKVADLAFQTANLGQTTFPELASEMGKAVPMAATLGVNMESLFGAMATLTGVTGGTNEVATQLRATFAALLNPTAQMQQTLTKLGFTNGRTMIQTLGLQGTLDLLAKATGGNTSQLAKMFGSVEALNAVLALTGAQSADFTEKTKAMTEAEGVSDEAFRKKTASVKGMWEQLKALGSVTLINVGELLLPPLQALLQWVVDNMPAIQQTMETVFGAVTTALQGLAPVFTWLRDNVLAPFVAAWLGDEAALSTPIGRFAAFVKGIWEAVAGYFTNWRSNIWEPFVQGWTGGNTRMGDVLSTTFAYIGSILRSLWDIVQLVWEAITLIWQTYGDEILAIAKAVWETILAVVDGALKVIKGILDFFIGLFTGDWDRMGKGLLEIWNGLWEAVGGILNGVREILKTIMVAIFGDFGQWMVDISDAMLAWANDTFVPIFQRAWQLIQDMFAIVTGIIRETLAAFAALFSGDWQGFVDHIHEVWKGLWDGITTLVSGAWELMKLAWDGLRAAIEGWFGDIITAAVGWGAAVVNGFIDGVKSMISGAISAVKGFAKSMIDGAKDTLGIHSPSRVFAGIGENIGQGLALGIAGTADLVSRAVGEITPGGVDVAVRSVRPAGVGSAAATGAVGGTRQPIVIQVGDQVLAEFILDTLTGTVRQPARALGIG